MIEGLGTKLKADGDPSGAPQPMQAAALSLTARPHSLQWMIAISSPYVDPVGLQEWLAVVRDLRVAGGCSRLSNPIENL
ncbi:MAG: hypothetical protein WA446_17890 [Steroidobacteraceae bacterium]